MCWSGSLRFAWLAPLLLPFAVMAGKGDSGDKQGATQVVPPREGMPAPVSQRKAVELPTLRCWQEGRLVLEQGGVQLAESPPGAIVLRRKGRDGETLRVFDMKNGLCMLSQEQAAIDSVK